MQSVRDKLSAFLDKSPGFPTVDWCSRARRDVRDKLSAFEDADKGVAWLHGPCSRSTRTSIARFLPFTDDPDQWSMLVASGGSPSRSHGRGPSHAPLDAERSGRGGQRDGQPGHVRLRRSERGGPSLRLLDENFETASAALGAGWDCGPWSLAVATCGTRRTQPMGSRSASAATDWGRRLIALHGFSDWTSCRVRT